MNCTCRVATFTGQVVDKYCPEHGGIAADRERQQQADDEAAQWVQLEIERRTCSICKQSIKQGYCWCTL